MKLKFGKYAGNAHNSLSKPWGDFPEGIELIWRKKDKEVEKNMLIHRQNGGLQFTQIIENGRSVLKSPESLFHTFW